jgi:hypothetical protein
MIDEIIKEMAKTISGPVKSIDIPLEKQDSIGGQMRIYACFFTCFHMYFKHLGYKDSLKEYMNKCLSLKAIDNGFSILDRNKMAIAAGFENLKCLDTNKNLNEKIMSSLSDGILLICSLNGEHYEVIADFDKVENIDGGKRVYSKSHDGSHRKITRIFWFE